MFWFLFLVTLFRIVYLIVLFQEQIFVFTDDGATRLLLSRMWAQDPWLQPQIPWLPLQFYLVGCLIKFFDLSVLTSGLGINVACVLILPWVYWFALPDGMSLKQKKWALLLISFWPWPLWLGGSGLSEPLLWLVGLIAWGSYQKRYEKTMMLCLSVLTMIHLEAWLFVVTLMLFYFQSNFKNKNWLKMMAWLCLVVAWPLFWQIQWQHTGNGWLALSARITDALSSYGSSIILKVFLFPALCFLIAPFWFLFLPSICKFFRDPQAKPIIVFSVLFWLSSICVALSTALPQRNLIFPLILLSPFLVRYASSKVIVLVLLSQLWILCHPQNPLHQDLQYERAGLAHYIKQVKQKTSSNLDVMIQLQPGHHAYLPRHLAVRGVDGDHLWVDHCPKRWKTSPQKNWEKYIIYEQPSLGTPPLVNYWRSWKPHESFLESFSQDEIQKILLENKIELIVTPDMQNWPQTMGWHFVGSSLSHRLWSRQKLKLKEFHYFAKLTADQRSSHKSLLSKLKREPFHLTTWKAILKMMGLWI